MPLDKNGYWVPKTGWTKIKREREEQDLFDARQMVESEQIRAGLEYTNQYNSDMNQMREASDASRSFSMLQSLQEMEALKPQEPEPTSLLEALKRFDAPSVGKQIGDGITSTIGKLGNFNPPVHEIGNNIGSAIAGTLDKDFIGDVLSKGADWATNKVLDGSFDLLQQAGKNLKSDETILGKVNKLAGMDQVAKGFYTPNLEDRAPLETFGAQMRTGLANTLSGWGGALEYGGDKLGLDSVESAGGELKDFGKQTQEQFTTPRQPFQWSDLKDPGFYTRTFAEQGPLMMSLMAPGMLASAAGGVAGGAIAGATRLSPFVQSVIRAGSAGIAGAAASRPIEAAMEASQVYDQMLQETGDTEIAKNAASKAFNGNLYLAGFDALEFASIFMPGATGKIGKALSGAGKVAGNMALEGTEEALQGVISRDAMNKPVEWDSEMQESFVIGALMGGGMGLASAIGERGEKMPALQKRVLEKLDDESQAQFAQVREEAKVAGKSDEEAAQIALDAIAEHPNGQDIIARSVKEEIESTQMAAETSAPVKLIPQEMLDLLKRPQETPQDLMAASAVEQVNEIAEAKSEPIQEPEIDVTPQTVYEAPDSDIEREVAAQYQLLKGQLENRGGVDQGELHRDESGDVVGRVGRMSNNPEWYQEFYAENGKVPNQQELMDLARKHVMEGYQEGGTYIPSLRHRQIADQLDEIESMYEQTTDESEREALIQSAEVLQEELAKINENRKPVRTLNNEAPAAEPPAAQAPAEQPVMESADPKAELQEAMRELDGPYEPKAGDRVKVGKNEFTVLEPREKGMFKLRSDKGAETYVHKNAMKHVPPARPAVPETEPMGEDSAYGHLPGARSEKSPIVKGSGERADYEITRTKPSKAHPEGRERIVVTRGGKKFYYDVTDNVVAPDQEANFRALGGVEGFRDAINNPNDAESMPELTGSSFLMDKEQFINYLEGRDYQANVKKRTYRDLPEDFNPTHVFPDGRKVQVQLTGAGRVMKWVAEDGEFGTTAADQFMAAPLNQQLGDGSGASIAEIRDHLANFKRNDYISYEQDGERRNGRLMNQPLHNVVVMPLDIDWDPVNQGDIKSQLTFDLTDPAVMSMRKVENVTPGGRRKLDDIADPRKKYREMAFKLNTSDAQPAHKAKLLQEMKEFAEAHDIPFSERYQELMDKFQAEADAGVKTEKKKTVKELQQERKEEQKSDPVPDKRGYLYEEPKMGISQEEYDAIQLGDIVTVAYKDGTPRSNGDPRWFLKTGPVIVRAENAHETAFDQLITDHIVKVEKAKPSNAKVKQEESITDSAGRVWDMKSYTDGTYLLDRYEGGEWFDSRKGNWDVIDKLLKTSGGMEVRESFHEMFGKKMSKTGYGELTKEDVERQKEIREAQETAAALDPAADDFSNETSNGTITRKGATLEVKFKNENLVPELQAALKAAGMRFTKKRGLWYGAYKREREELLDRLLRQAGPPTAQQMEAIENLVERSIERSERGDGLEYGLNGFYYNERGQLLVERNNLQNGRSLNYWVMYGAGRMEEGPKYSAVNRDALIPAVDITQLRNDAQERMETLRRDMAERYASERPEIEIEEAAPADPDSLVGEEVDVLLDHNHAADAIPDGGAMKEFFEGKRGQGAGDITRILQKDGDRYFVETSADSGYFVEVIPDGAKFRSTGVYQAEVTPAAEPAVKPGKVKSGMYVQWNDETWYVDEVHNKKYPTEILVLQNADPENREGAGLGRAVMTKEIQAIVPDPNEAAESSSAPRTLAPLPEDPAAVKPEAFDAYVKAMRSLMDAFKGHFRDDTLPTTQAGLRKAASEVLGRPATEDEWSDALEAAAQEYAAGAVVTDQPRLDQVKELIELGGSLESKLKNAGRSLEKRERQQFSTPIPLAAIAGYALDAKAGDTIKEGSAGTGSLILPLRQLGAAVKAIELSPRRAAILTAMGFDVTNSDTFKVSAGELQVDGVIGNPPFKGQNVGKGTGAFAGKPPWKGGWGDLGNRFLAWDLRGLPEGGRLVYVTSPGVIDNQQNANFRKWLRENHTVRAMIKIHEGGYDSRGTTFGAGLIIVDKGKTEAAPDSISGTAESWENLLEMIQPVTEGGTHAKVARATNTSGRTRGNRSGSEGTDVRADAGGERASGTASADEGGREGLLDGNSEGGSAGRSDRGRSDEPGRETGESVLSDTDAGQRPADVVERDEDGLQTGVSGEPASPGRTDDERASDAKARKSRKSANIDVQGYVEYVPGRRFTGEKHRGDVVEAGSLALVSAPEEIFDNEKYAPHPRVMKGGVYKLSDVQLEPVVLAKYNWDQGKRGILIADDTGLGKTAEQLAIAADAWHSGRAKRILFVTTSDAVAEGSFLSDNEKLGLGLPITMVNSNTHKNFKDDIHEQRPKEWKELPIGDGAIVMSKYTFSESAEALRVWLDGTKGDILVLFDESHEYANVDSGRGTAATDLYQKFHDKGQFIYASATAAENLENLEHLYGLKLWSPGRFGDFQTRLKGYEPSKSTGGKSSKANPMSKSLGKNRDPFAREIPLTMMEQIVRELKASGQYIGRSLSMEGIEMVPLPIDLSSEDRGDWNRSIEFIRRIALKAEEHGLKPTDRGKIMSQVVGYTRRLRGFYVMKGIIKHMQSELASPSGLRRFVLSAELIGSTEEGPPATLQAAIRSINDKSKAKDSSGDTVEFDLPEAIEDKVQLQAMLEGNHADYNFQRPVPDLPSPIKMLYDAFGEDQVSIVTGKVKDGERLSSVDAFVSGQTPIMFFNAAGNTGISLHDTIGTKIGFYHVDYPYNAKNAKQSEGRVNRTGQVTKPVMFYPYTDSAVDTKFVGTLLARSESMGALSRGKSSKLGGETLESFDFTGAVAETTVYRYIADLDVDLRADMFGEFTREYPTGAELDESTIRSMFGSSGVNMKKFINSIMFLDFKSGNRVMNEFTVKYKEVLQEYADAGGVTDRFRSYKGELITSSEGTGGIALRRVKTKLSDAERRAISRALSKAEIEVEEAQEKLAKAKEEASTKLAEQLQVAKAKYDEAKEANNKVLREYREAAQTRGMDPKELQKIEARRDKSRTEESHRFNKQFELSRQLTRLGDPRYQEEVYSEMPAVRRAQAALKSANSKLLNAQADAENNDVVTVIDGTFATNGLMVPIRAAIRNAAKEHYGSEEPPEAALKVDLRAYFMDDGSKVVGAVVPTWAESKVAEALNARMKYTGKADDAAALMEFIKGGNNVSTEGGFVLSWKPKLKQLVIEGMRSTTHRDLFYQLQNEAGKEAIGYIAASQAFALMNEQGLSTFIKRYPIKELGTNSSARSLEDAIQDRRHERERGGMGIVPKMFQGGKIKDSKGPAATSGKFAYANEKLEKEYQAAKGMQKESLVERIRERVEQFKNGITREFEHLPHIATFSQLRFDLLALESQVGVAEQKTIDIYLRSIVSGLTKDEFDLFSRKVFLDDQYAEYLAGNALNFEMDAATLLTEKDLVDQAVEESEAVKRSIEVRKEVWDSVKESYINSGKVIGVNMESRLKKGDSYFRHQVMNIVNDAYGNFKQKKVKANTNRGFLQQRSGEYTGAINTDYLQAEFDVMSKMLVDTEINNTIAKIQDNPELNIIKRLKREANEANAQKLDALMDAEKASKKHMRAEKIDKRQGRMSLNVNEKMVPFSPLEDALKGFNKTQAIAYSQFTKLSPSDLWAGEENEHLTAVKFLTGKSKFDPLMDIGDIGSLSGARGEVMAYLAELAGRPDGDPGVMQARMILSAIGKKNKRIKDALGKNMQTWKKLIPEGFAIWQAQEGSRFHQAQAIDMEKVARDIESGVLKELVDAETLEEYTRTVWARGARYPEMVLDERVIATLDTLLGTENHGAIQKTVRRVTGMIKTALLFGPTRYPKYAMRNISGDLDKIIANNPGALKKMPQAARELYGVIFQGRAMTPDMRAWFNLGGMQALYTVQEDVAQLQQLNVFSRFYDKQPNMGKKAWEFYWRSIKKMDNFREATSRYAMYMNYLEQIDNNADKGKGSVPNNYGSSIPEEVDALKSHRDKAYKLSNEAMINYAQTSKIGRELRETWMPFWSFMEGNFRSTSQMFKNVTHDHGLAVAVGRKLLGKTAGKGAYVAYRAGTFAIRYSLLYGMLMLYNTLLWDDEEKELPEDVQKSLHIIYGRDANGKVRYLDKLGVMEDFAQWFGADDLMTDVKDVLDGRRTVQEVLYEGASKPLNKLAQGTNMVGKTVLEAATGYALFPNVFKPSKHNDTWYDHLVEVFGIGNEYQAVKKALSTEVAGAPYDFRNIFSSGSDPLQASYYDIKDKVRAFRKRQGDSVGGGSPDEVGPRGEALYQYKQALRYGDKEAMKIAMQKYALAGGKASGVGQSLKAMDPLFGLSQGEKGMFLHNLSEEDKATYDRAVRFYTETLLGSKNSSSK